MITSSRILSALASRYGSSRAGRTSRATLDFQIDFHRLLELAEATTGSAHELALSDLAAAAKAGVIGLDIHPKDRTLIEKVRIPKGGEDAFFRYLGIPSPVSQRESLAAQVAAMAEIDVPATDAVLWREFCLAHAERIREGLSRGVLEGVDGEQADEILRTAARLLHWKGESYLRFASCVVCGNSKKLQKLQPRVEPILHQVTGGRISTLADLGITETGGGLWLHGPATLLFENRPLDFGGLALPIHLSATDLHRGRLQTSARRWLTVENETSLHELAKLRSDTLLISSGYRGGVANSAVISLLRAAPADCELWHFGDSDPKGFDILRDLRARTGHAIASLHMRYRPADPPAPLSLRDVQLLHTLIASPDFEEAERQSLREMLEHREKGRYEQESLGLPQAAWPFYETDSLPR